MSSVEQERVESLSDWYLKEQLDFDKRLIGFRYKTIKPRLVGSRGLELGPAEGEMTQFLVNDFEQLTIVEGSAELLAQIPERANLIKIHALFEEFQPAQRWPVRSSSILRGLWPNRSNAASART